jgi:membrane protein DedA with SNARE-associated domain
VEAWIALLIAFLQAHAAWATPIAFALAFFKALAFVSLVVPGMTILFAIGALIGAAHLPFVPIWIAISLGAALGDWVSYAIGTHFQDRARRLGPLARHPALMARAEAFFARWGVLSVALCRFVGPLRATIPLLCGIFGLAFWPFQIANWVSAFAWAGLMLAPGTVLLGWLG